MFLNQYINFFHKYKTSFKDFAKLCNKVWRYPHNYIVVDRSKIKNTNGMLIGIGEFYNLLRSSQDYIFFYTYNYD